MECCQCSACCAQPHSSCRPLSQQTVLLDILEDYAPGGLSMHDAAAGADPDLLEEAEERLLDLGFSGSKEKIAAADAVLKVVAICSSFAREGPGAVGSSSDEQALKER